MGKLPTCYGTATDLFMLQTC